MRKITLDKINKKNILDIMYEPDKNRYSVIEFDSTRKEITRKEFLYLLNYPLGLEKEI